MRYSEAKRLIAIDLYQTKLSTHAVASRLGLSSSTVARWLNDAGVMRMKAYRAEQEAPRWQLVSVAPAAPLPREQRDAMGHRLALEHFIPMPLPAGGLYAAGFFRRGG